MRPLTGWALGADGHWITKLMGVALLTPAYVAWIFRSKPHLDVAMGLASYQLASATVDWVMWLLMADAGFSNALARSSVSAAIVSHYAIGILLLVAIVRNR